jgi:hypothetical protein
MWSSSKRLAVRTIVTLNPLLLLEDFLGFALGRRSCGHPFELAGCDALLARAVDRKDRIIALTEKILVTEMKSRATILLGHRQFPVNGRP